MPFPKKQTYVVNLSTKKHILFLAENWNLKVEAVCKIYIWFSKIIVDISLLVLKLFKEIDIKDAILKLLVLPKFNFYVTSHFQVMET